MSGTIAIRIMKIIVHRVNASMKVRVGGVGRGGSEVGILRVLDFVNFGKLLFAINGKVGGEIGVSQTV